MAMTKEQAKALAAARLRLKNKPAGEPYSGTLLPFTKDEQGDVSFDSDAGIVGVIKRALMLTGDTMTGELDLESEEGKKRLFEAAAILSPMGAAGRVSGSVLAPKTAYKTVTPKAPTREALGEASSAAYKAADDLGVEYSASAVKTMADDIVRTLDEGGFIAELAPETHTLLSKLQSPPSGATVKLRSLDALRKRMGEVAGSPDKTKASSASQAIRAIDDFIGSSDPSNVVARASAKREGLAPQGYNFAAADRDAAGALSKEASEAITAARGDAAAAFRSDEITGLENLIGQRAASANSGRNFDNTARQRLVSLLNNKKKMRGFSDAEKQAITDIIEGTPSKNAARYVGNLLGGGGGMGQSLTTFGPAALVGSTGGGMNEVLASMVPGAIGAASKGLSNRMTAKGIRELDEMVRARSPLGQAAGPARQVYDPQITQEALTRALMMQTGTNPQLPIDMNTALGVR